MDVVTNRPVLSEPYTALARATGIIGIVFIVLLFGPIIALSTAGEPPLDATASEAVRYFGNIEANWAQLAIAASTLGWIGSLWLIVAGLGLVAARFVWTRELWTVPYLLFWVWAFVLSIRLIRRPNLLDPVES